MKEVRTKLKIWNVLDEEKIRNGELQLKEYEAIADSGALRMSLPEEIATELNLLRAKRKMTVEYANI